MTLANCCYEDFSDFDGSVLIAEATQGNVICARGNWVGAPVWFGEAYEFRYRFSGFRLPTPPGRSGPAVQSVARVRRLFIRFHDTHYFRVVVQPERRQPAVYEFDGTVLDSRASQVGSRLGTGLDIDRTSYFQGVFQVPIQSEGLRVNVDIINDSAAPCQFLGAEWIGRQGRASLT